MLLLLLRERRDAVDFHVHLFAVLLLLDTLSPSCRPAVRRSKSPVPTLVYVLIKAHHTTLNWEQEHSAVGGCRLRCIPSTAKKKKEQGRGLREGPQTRATESAGKYKKTLDRDKTPTKKKNQKKIQRKHTPAFFIPRGVQTRISCYQRAQHPRAILVSSTCAWKLLI